MNNKRNIIINVILLLIAITFTILVKVVDVKTIGIDNSSIGFATINQFIFETIGVNMIWYHITDYLGLIAILFALVYAFMGFIQLIKKRSIFKVDKKFILLGIYYVAVIAIYLFFEKVIINYRPILIDGIKEASYPSSHTVLTICICGSSILINKLLFNKKITKILNILLTIILIVTVIGRLISGVHWFTDIIGGILISSSLLMTFYNSLNIIKK